jgi:hypothetical protein
MREAQMEALALENVGYATNADHGIAPKIFHILDFTPLSEYYQQGLCLPRQARDTRTAYSC